MAGDKREEAIKNPSAGTGSSEGVLILSGRVRTVKMTLSEISSILKRQARCGEDVIVLKGIKVGSGDVVYKVVPSSCHSVLCPKCSHDELTRFFKKYAVKFKRHLKRGCKISFITLTIPSRASLSEMLDILYAMMLKLGSLNISKKFIRELEKSSYAELRKYIIGLRGRSIKERSEIAKLWVKRIRRFVEYLSQFSGKKFRNIARFIFKLEVSYTDNGWHAHWHGVSDVLIPRFVMLAIWKRLYRETFMEDANDLIIDLRQVRGVKGLIELSKYTVKPVISLDEIDLIIGNILAKIESSSSVEEVRSKLSGDEYVFFEVLYNLRYRRRVLAWNINPSESEEDTEDKEDKDVRWVAVSERAFWVDIGRYDYVVDRAVRSGKRSLKVVAVFNFYYYEVVVLRLRKGKVRVLDVKQFVNSYEVEEYLSGVGPPSVSPEEQYVGNLPF